MSDFLFFDPTGFWKTFYQNTQNILTANSGNTTTINNFAGNKAIEEAVVSEVASYGSQLGWLADIVLTLAKKSNLKTKEVEQLSNAAARIAKIKDAINESALSRAKDALDTLKKKDPDALEELLRDYGSAKLRKAAK